MVDVNELNKAPPGYPTGEDVPPDAYLHMIVGKKIKPLPKEDSIPPEEVEEPRDECYGNVSFRDAAHGGCRCTDMAFLVFYVLLLICMFGLVVYCWGDSHYYLAFNEYSEKCKVVCSMLEVPKTYDKKEDFECSKANKYIIKPRIEMNFYLEGDEVLMHCIKDCEKFHSFEAFGDNCVESLGNQTVAHYANQMKMDTKLIETTLIAERPDILGILFATPVGLALLMLILLRIFNSMFLWILVPLTLAGILAVTSYIALLHWTQREEGGFEVFPTLSIVYLSCWGLFSIYVIFFLISSVLKRWHKTVHLLQFAGHAITFCLFMEPILTMILLCLCHFLILIMLSIVECVGRLHYVDHYFTYEKFNAKDVARAIVLFMFWWTCHLLIAAQHIVVARVVALKCLYGKSITALASHGNLCRYHLGSACMGSFVFSVLSFVKDIIESFVRMGSVRCNPCTASEYDITYPTGGPCFVPMSRVSYIPVCLFCEHFVPGGRKASLLFVQRHLVNWRAAKHFLMMVHGFILAIATGVNLFLYSDHLILEDMVYPVVVYSILVYFVAQAAIGLFRMTIDTLFFCYCYDLALNDGHTRPYVTSMPFIEFVKDAPISKVRKYRMRVKKDKKEKEEKEKKKKKKKKKKKDSPKKKESKGKKEKKQKQAKPKKEKRSKTKKEKVKKEKTKSSKPKKKKKNKVTPE